MVSRFFLPAAGSRSSTHDPSAGRVVAAAVVLDRRAPGLERPHLKGVALEVLAGVVQHLVGVPVVGQRSRRRRAPAARCRTCRGPPPAARRASSRASCLRKRCSFPAVGRRRGRFVRAVSYRFGATAAAASADAMSIEAFGSVARISASGNADAHHLPLLVREAAAASRCARRGDGRSGPAASGIRTPAACVCGRKL